MHPEAPKDLTHNPQPWWQMMALIARCGGPGEPNYKTCTLHPWQVMALIAAVESLKKDLEIPATIREVVGEAKEAEFLADTYSLAKQAFDDQCTGVCMHACLCMCVLPWVYLCVCVLCVCARARAHLCVCMC